METQYVSIDYVLQCYEKHLQSYPSYTLMYFQVLFVRVHI